MLTQPPPYRTFAETLPPAVAHTINPDEAFTGAITTMLGCARAISAANTTIEITGARGPLADRARHTLTHPGQRRALEPWDLDNQP